MRKDKGSILYRFFRDLGAFIIRLYGRIEVHGVENVPTEGSCILASNHASFIDPLLVSGCLRRINRGVRYLARDTLFKGLTGWVLRNVDVIPMNREGGDVGALRRAIATIKGGGLVCLFPEGTRSPDGKLQKPKGGIGFLVIKSGVPVVPVYIDGAYEAMPSEARWIRRHHIRIYFGKPMPPEIFEQRDLPRETYMAAGEKIMAEIASLKAQGRSSEGESRLPDRTD